ncbi:MAG: hypothetical protein AAF571_08835 [Verrucomicrobiota bacterium]
MWNPFNTAVLIPIEQAWKQMLRVLFEPFHIQKWFIIGFSCFLAKLVEYLSNVHSAISSVIPENETSTFSSLSHSAEGFVGLFSISSLLGQSGDQNFLNWLESLSHSMGSFNVDALIVVLVLGILAAITLFLLAITWLDCRGVFMFIDNIALDRGDIIESWKKYASQAWQLFWFYLILLIAVIAVIVVGGYTIKTLGVTFDRENPITLLLLGLAFLGFSLLTALLLFLFKASVIPRMFAGPYGLLPALLDSLQLLAKYPLEWILFTMVHFALWLASYFIIIFCCITSCCMAYLPYIHFVVFLPLYLFLMSYNLTFIRQFGTGWDVFAAGNTDEASSHDS